MMLKSIISAIVALVVSAACACQAITQQGTRCKRPQEPYCWQHGGPKSTTTTTSYSTYKPHIDTTTTATTPSVTLPKSYEVHSQRTQGGRTFSRSMKWKKYKEQGGMCPHCGNKFEYSKMHGDHIVPYSKGGKTEYSNLQMLCAPCNLKKGNRYSY